MNRLYRSKTNTMIAGVCGGLGEHLGIDPTLVRLVFILLTLISGVGLLLYLVLLILVPQGGQDKPAVDEIAAPMVAEAGAGNTGQPHASPAEGKAPETRNVTLFLGIALIVFGAAYLLRNLNFRWFRWFGWHTFWPLILIAIGLAVLVRPAKGE